MCAHLTPPVADAHHATDDTVDPQTGIWHGFAMIVTNDSGSNYSITPSLTLRYRSAPPQSLESSFDQKASISSSTSSKSGATKVDGQNIFVYHASHGGNTFWRFKLEVHLSDVEQPVAYSINGGAELQFWVPGRNQNMRWMGHSCNGFSSGVKTEGAFGLFCSEARLTRLRADFNGPSPLWKDFLQAHAKHPFHVVVGGGDQVRSTLLSRSCVCVLTRRTDLLRSDGQGARAR